MHDPYLISTQRYMICTVCKQPAVDGRFVDAVTNRCRACLNLSHLHYSCQRCALAVAQHCPSPTTKCTRTFNFWEIFKRAFKIYGIWPQANKHVCIHTHLLNAVSLVWGSLRLAPIMLHVCTYHHL